jgi:hypothetical protein
MSAILAFLVLLLSTHPIVELTAAASNKGCMKQMSCCKKKTACEKKESKQNNKDACRNGCNPFMPCSSCCYFIAEKPALSFEPVFKIIGKTMEEISFISHYHHDVWQPPELI